MKTSTSSTHPNKRAPAKAKKPANDSGETPVRIFVSYSHKDSGAQEQLEIHLAPLKRDGVSIWFDGDINAGDALDASISRELRQADIFVALLSPDYLHSRYCWDIEYKRAMNRRARGTMRVVAVVVRSCDWRSTRAARFKLLPEDGKPVTKWRSSDDAFLNVAEGLRGVVKAFRRQSAAPVTKSILQPGKMAPKKFPVAKPRRTDTPIHGKGSKTRAEGKQKPAPARRR